MEAPKKDKKSHTKLETDKKIKEDAPTEKIKVKDEGKSSKKRLSKEKDDLS